MPGRLRRLRLQIIFRPGARHTLQTPAIRTRSIPLRAVGPLNGTGTATDRGTVRPRRQRHGPSAQQRFGARGWAGNPDSQNARWPSLANRQAADPQLMYVADARDYETPASATAVGTLAGPSLEFLTIHGRACATFRHTDCSTFLGNPRLSAKPTGRSPAKI